MVSFTGVTVGIVNACTSYYNSWSNQMNPISKWRFTKVYINIDAIAKYSSTQKQGMFAHEIGHTLGLTENNTNPNSIMCQAGYNRAVYTVQQCDNTPAVAACNK